MIRVKDSSVQYTRLTPAAFHAWYVADSVYSKYGYECILTSGHEQSAKHSYQSLHYSGNAIDLSVTTVPEGNRENIRQEISDRLGLDYDVLYERAPDHYHIEVQQRHRL